MDSDFKTAFVWLKSKKMVRFCSKMWYNTFEESVGLGFVSF